MTTTDWSVDDEADDDGDDDGEVDDGGVYSGPTGGAVDPGTGPTAGVAPRPTDTRYDLPAIVPATAEPVVAPAAPDPGLPTSVVAPTLPPTHASRVTPAEPVVAGPPAPVAPARPATTSWDDHRTPVPVNAQGASLRAPGRRPRVRRVTRVLRHIDPWSTFKVGLLFSAVAYVVFLTAGVLLWRVADSTGTLDNVERWFTQFGWETFELKGEEIFHNAWILGLFGVVALTGGLVLLATLFNLVSDIVGGVRMTVLEEEVVERTISSTRRYVVRRPPLGAAHDAAPAWDVDGDDADTAESPGAPASVEPPGADLSPAVDWTVDDDDDGDDGDEVPTSRPTVG